MGLTMSQIFINPSTMPLSMVTGTHDLINQAEKPKLTSVFWSQGILVEEKDRVHMALTMAISGTQLHAQISNCMQRFLQGPNLFALLMYANLTEQREVFRGT